MKSNYCVEVKPVTNGFLVEENWREKLDPSKDFDEYKSEKYVFTRYVEVAQFMQEHLAEAQDYQLGH